MLFSMLIGIPLALLFASGLFEGIVDTSNTRTTNATLLTCNRAQGGIEIRYQFTVDETSYVRIETLSNQQCSDYNFSVRVSYVRENPQESRIISGVDDPSLVFGVLIFGCLFLILGTFIFSYTVYPLIAVGIYIRGFIHYRRLKRCGTVIEGEIHSIKTFQSRRLRPRNSKIDPDEDLCLEVKYQFIAPDSDKYITGKQVKRYDKSRHQPMLSIGRRVQGTPVKVLYADDHAHVML